MIAANPAQSTILHGRRILVAEDEYMIAMEMSETLSKAGVETLGPVPGVADALQLVAAEGGRVDAALLDVNLRGEAVWPVVDALLERGIPVMLTSGYDAGAIPQAYAALPRYEKPISMGDLLRALNRVLTSPKRT